MDDVTGERWRAIPGYVGLYEASDLGRVRRIVGRNGHGFYPRVTILKLRMGKQGYCIVRLWCDCERTTHMVHRLVARAFLGSRPEGLEIRHLDDNKLNNRLSNLVYGTRRENKLDSVRNGIHPESLKTHCPYEHEYTEENTYRVPGKPNRRFCRICQRRRNQEYETRKKERLAAA